MGKHTKFDSSDDESSHRDRKERKSHHKEKKHEKRDRSRSPHEKREKSPKREKYEEKSESSRHTQEHRRRDYGTRDDRGGWKKERKSDFQKKEDKNRLSAEEIAAQRKALWGNKKPAESTKPDPTAESSEPTSSGSAKNEKLWSSAIAATGVDSSQASKFMRLMGVKNAPKTCDDSTKLSEEKGRQDKMTSDLEQQYAVARNMRGRGNGIGFGH